MRSYKLDVHVAPKHHARLIGPHGVNLANIRNDFPNVKVQFPGKGQGHSDGAAEGPGKSDNATDGRGHGGDIITLTGTEADVKAVSDRLLKMADDLVC